MANPQEVESWRKAYAKKTEAELIAITHQKVPYCSEHIAAVLLLSEKKEERESERHNKIERRLSELKKPHWPIVPTFIIVVVTLGVAILTWLFPRAPSDQKDGSKIVVVPAPLAPPPQPAHTVAPVPVAAPPSPKVDAAATPATQPKP